jgi:hypothetical protein
MTGSWKAYVIEFCLQEEEKKKFWFVEKCYHREDLNLIVNIQSLVY